MANTLANILPKILARGLLALREQAIMPRLVNSDFSMEAAEKGDTIDVPLPSAVKVVDVVPGPVPPTPADTVTRKVQIPLDQWKQSEGFHLTDKEMTEINRNEHFIPMQVSEAIRGLASEVNRSIHNRYKGIFGFVGIPGTVPFDSDVKDATNARKVLNRQRCPRSNRRGVLDFDAEAAALSLKEFSDAEKVSSSDVKLEGEIGRKYGIDWASDDEVVTHTAGTQTGAPAVTGAEAIGETTIDFTTAGGEALDLLEGDIITFSGPTGHDQTYAVTADVTIGASTTGVVPIAGPGKVGVSNVGLAVALVGGETITIKTTHVVNLAFHRDAFAYATRPLAQETQDLALGNQIMTMQDPMTGIVLRLEISRQHKQTVWEFDQLWGTQLVRPELAVRIAG